MVGRSHHAIGQPGIGACQRAGIKRAGLKPRLNGSPSGFLHVAQQSNHAAADLFCVLR